MSDFAIIIAVKTDDYKKKGKWPMNKTMKKAGLAAGLAGLAAGFLAFENNALTVSRIKLTSPKIPEGERLKMVLVSDLQSKTFGKAQHRLVKKIASCRPDVILFVGDIVDRNHTDFEACCELARGLGTVAPVCYVNGNHESSLDDEEVNAMYERMEKYGWNLILDKGCTAHVMSRVKDGTSYKICIAGISEETLNESRGGNRFSPVHDGEMIVKAGSEAVKGAKSAAGTDDAFTVLLAHEPQFISDYAKCGADLIACGHAHGGQIRIPGTDMGLFAPEQGVLPKYTSGIYDCGKAKMAVSRGLGNSTFPFRIFNRPEIVVIDVESECADGADAGRVKS